MSGIDVEALLESTAAEPTAPTAESAPKEGDSDSTRKDRGERHDRARDRDGERKRRDRSRDRRPEKDADGDDDMKSPKSDRASANESHRSRKRSRSRGNDRRRSRRDHYEDDAHRSSGGDYYRGGRGGGRGGDRSRSRSPVDDRYYRPTGQPRHNGDEREDDKRRNRRDRDKPAASPKTGSKTPEPQLTEDERDRRTVFVQQLAARSRTKDLVSFFEKVGPVKEAQIVKDRVSGRSKG